MTASIKAVFDCNVLLQALTRPNGPAGRCFDGVIAGKVDLHVSLFILEELADVVARPNLVAKLRLTASRTTKFFDLLCTHASLIETPAAVFHGCRDPDDDHYINLALPLEKPVIVSRDKDLLDLRLNATSSAQPPHALCPELRIMTPPEFLILLNERP